MNRITHLLARPVALAVTGLALVLGVTSCATTANVAATSDFDHAVNFRAYRTWAWYPKQTNDTEGGPARGYESFTDQRIRDAVTKDLAAKSLTEVASNASPDVYVAYSVRVENKQQLAGGYPYSPYGYGYGGFGYGGYGYPYGGGRAYNYKAGTVIIDIVDAKRKELAWRGTGQAQLDNNSISEEETYRIVNSVLGNYPPTDTRRQATR